MAYDQTLIDSIKNTLIKKEGKTINAAVIRRDWFKTSDLCKKIIESTNFLDQKNPTMGERIYCLFNDITELPICNYCKSYTRKYISSQQGYKSCINMECMRKYVKWESSSKTKISNNISNYTKFLGEYHDKNYQLISIEDIKAYIKDKKNRENTNVAYVTDKTLIEDRDILMSSIFYTEKALPLLEDKKLLKMSKRFHFIYNDLKEIPLCKCGKPSKFLNFYIGYQKECSNLCRCYNQLTTIKNNVLDNQNLEILSDFDVLKGNEFIIRCLNCNEIHERPLTNSRWKDIYCPTCYGDAGISKEEKDVLKYIKTISSDPLEENIKINGSEIDIFIPSKNIGIEYNGLLWHSFGNSFPSNLEEERVQKNKHLKKTIGCNLNNIKLFHINSDEWYSPIQQNIWKSILSNSLGKSIKIFARKCVLKVDVSYDESKKFLEKNHMQGSDNSPIRIGLYHNGELVSLMTFSKPRFSKIYDYELVRYCNKTLHSVIGGASKIFKHFLKSYTPKTVISYADLRYSDGKLYKNLNFRFKENSKLGYFYIKGIGTKKYKKISRVSAQKHKLPKLLENFDKNLTESINMFNNGYRRVWNCGNMVFIYENDDIKV